MDEESQSSSLVPRILAGLGLSTLTISSLTFTITILTTPQETHPTWPILQAGNAAAIPAFLLLLASFAFKYPPKAVMKTAPDIELDIPEEEQ